MPPKIRSAPSPARIVSLSWLPQMMSLPAPLITESTPNPPTSELLPLPPAMRVVAAVADDEVVAAAGDDRVGPVVQIRSAHHGVVALAGEDRVVALVAEQAVVAAGAVEQPAPPPLVLYRLSSPLTQACSCE